MMLAAVVPMALLAFLPAVEAGAELGPPVEAGGGEKGFHGFEQFDTHADSKILTLTGFLNAFREDNSVVGAVSEINGPPATSRNIAAFFLRGQGATFVYGAIGSPGGARGTLPDPPPGEANAYYPTSDPPYEMTWTGPITGLGVPQVVDSKFHAKASDVPTGRADGAVTALDSPGYFSIGQATVVSHTEPAEGGVVAEGVSVVHELKVGPLLIQNIVSRAYAFVPTSGDPKGIATTVIDGAKVGETPVQITDKGIVVADQTNPLNQEQVNKAMADAGYPQVRLIPSIAQASEDGSGVSSTAGTLEFVKQDEKFGASNPQGFSGGGFSIGGAAATVSTRRCSPDCGGGLGGSTDIIGSEPDGSSGSDGSSPDSTGVSDLGGSGGATLDSGDLGYGASSTGTLTTDTSGAGIGGSTNLSSDTGGGGVGLGSGGAGVGSSSTTAVTPSTPNEQAAAGVATPGAGVAVQQQAAVAFTELGPKSAEWLRDLYLMAGLALGIIFVGQRLARAFA
ncbi:MAG TPA: hypothetical protein VG795_06070 [Acidimicrobiia bacterium]|nr:hypothetical protein [Acidimicrobiia bacterium]